MQGIAALLVAATAAFALPMAAQAQDADAAKGKQIFTRCQACHSIEAGTNKVGPRYEVILPSVSINAKEIGRAHV